MERKLATIAKIEEIREHPNADALELAKIRGWQVVVKKGEFWDGDLCVYCEVDSLMPERSEFEFLAPRKYRIKTTKLRGQISQGIAFPIEVLESVGKLQSVLSDPNWDTLLLLNKPLENGDEAIPIVPGQDVTEALGVIKYDPPIPASLGGTAKGRFPSHSIKTDEERIQNLTEIFEYYRTNYAWVATEKLDGSSVTFSIYDDEFIVCSRNLNLKEHPENEKNSFWKFARENDIEGKMRAFMEKNDLKALTLQGELVGEGIQKNKYRLKGQTVYFFRVFDPIEYKFFSVVDSYFFITKSMDLNFVPIIEDDMTLPDTVDKLIEYADGRSALYDTAREGVVFVADSKIYPDAKDLDDYQGRLSFKVISNKFILKHDA